MLPTRRDLHFRLDPSLICTWRNADRKTTHFYNALSIFFPEGERFFIHSVRHFRDRISDPELQQAVTAFIGQEAMHGREHTEYNEAMQAAGLPVHTLESIVTAILERLKLKLPAQMQLSTTIALEHLTAIIADALLNHPQWIDDADPNYRALWRWHALEETEHKAVAFDVYDRVFGRGTAAYLQRCTGLIGATALFWPLVLAFHLSLIRADRKAPRFRGWGDVVSMLWHPREGLFPNITRPWLDYFRRDFHPWDHDNRAQLERMAEWVAPIKISEPALVA